MLKLQMLAVMVAVAAQTKARALDVPDFDVYAHCQKVAAYGGTFSESSYEDCSRVEQDALVSMLQKWSDLPGSIRRYCLRVTRFGGDRSYSTLKECVDFELAYPSPTRRASPPAALHSVPQFRLVTPDNRKGALYDSLFECSNARARSTAQWAICVK
jgi:hypothetical protein